MDGVSKRVPYDTGSGILLQLIQGGRGEGEGRGREELVYI